MVSATETREDEWGFAVVGMIAVALLAVGTLVGWGLYERFHIEPSRFDVTVRCLTGERRLVIEYGQHDPLAASATGGWLATTVETNGVHISIARSTDEAVRIASAYQSIAGDLGGRLERRGTHVYLWDRPASPTQRQALYDCEY